MTWYDRTGQNAAQLGQNGLINVSDMSAEVADATADDDPNPIGHAVVSGLHSVWNATMFLGDWYNRNVYQKVIDDPIVFANLAIQTPFYKQSDESLSDYLKAAWNARDEIPLGSSVFQVGAVSALSSRLGGDSYGNPVTDPEGFQANIASNPISSFTSGVYGLGTSLVADPLNYVGGPTKALSAGLTAPKLVSDIEKAQTGILRTKGVVSVTKVNDLLDAGSMDETLRRLASISDPKVTREYLNTLKLDARDPDTLSYLSSQIDSVEGQKDLFSIAINPHSDEAAQAATRLKASNGADFEYYARKVGGGDPLAPEMYATADDLLLGPQTSEVMTAVVDKADAANAAALNRAEAFARGVDKMTSASAPWTVNAPTTNPLFERYAFRKAARSTATISNDPIVSTYQPHRLHPATWYVEKPSGLVEPDSPNGFAEMDASIRQLDKLLSSRYGDKVDFIGSGRADEFADRWFRASTLADPAHERAKVAAGLNKYAVNALVKKFHGDALDEGQMNALNDLIEAKARRMNQEIRDKGWLSAATDSGSIGIVRHPLLQRATENAVNLYDFQALSRTIEKFDTPGFRANLIAAMEGSTSATDALMGVWKIGVLMRLGYTIRNLAEASMSIAATGHLGETLSAVGSDRMRSWLQATTRAGGRRIDSLGVAGGVLDTPQALRGQLQAWSGVRAATDATANNVLGSLDPAQIRRLATSTDPERQAQARVLQGLRVDLESKQVTYHGRPAAKVDAEAGNLAEGWQPSKNRALSTTPSRTAAAVKGSAHQVTSFGDTFDFTKSATGPFDQRLVKAAKGGDRAAVQRLSDAAVNRGYGRIVLPDSADWGGLQVVVNQRAIGPGARTRLVESKIKRLIDEADEKAIAPTISKPTLAQKRGANRAAKKAWTRGAPMSVNPNFDDDLIDSMLNGGVESFVDKLATRRVAIDAQEDFLSQRLANARARVTKTARLRTQGKGFQQGTDAIFSPYGHTYENRPEAFAGHGGGYWEGAISNDTSYSILAGDSYQASQARGAMVSKVVQPENPRYFEAWANILNLHFRDFQSGTVDQAVRRIIDGESFDDILTWATTTPDGYQWSRSLGLVNRGGGTVPEIAKKADLADLDTVEKGVASLMSAVDLYVPRGPIRDALSSGAAIDEDLLRAATEGQPLNPLQALLVPSSAEATREMTIHQKFMHGTVAGIMRVLGSIPETSFARHPLFASTFQTERRTMIGLAEQANGGGRLTFKELADIDLKARQQAQRTVERTLFTLVRRSSLSGNAAIRATFPFVAAWENVLQRWSHFVAEDPMLPVRFSNYVNKFNNGVTVVDSNGNEVGTKDYPDDAMLVLPGLDSLHLPGRFGEAASLLASQTLVPVKSLDVLTQGQPLNPGLGPLGVLPITKLVRSRPEFQKAFAWALPYGVPESDVDIFMPTAMQRARQIWGDSSVATNTMSKAWLLATYRYEHEGGPKPKLEDAERAASSMAMLRMAMSMTAPFATSVTSERDFYAGKMRDYQTIYGQDDGETRFFHDFPDASLLVESLSKNPSGARATVQAVDNAKKYRSEVAAAYGDSDPKVAGFIMNYGVSDDAPFSQAAYQWQRQHAPVKGSQDTYRQVGNPEDQVREAHIREGWDLYRQVTDQVAAQLQMSGVDPDSTVYAKTMTATKQVVVNYLTTEAKNTAWYAEYKNPDTAKYYRRAESFKKLLDDTSFSRDHGSDTLVQSIRAFLAERDVVISELQRRKMSGGAASLSAEANTGLAAAFTADIERLGADSPEFRAWHSEFFANDDVAA